MKECSLREHSGIVFHSSGRLPYGRHSKFNHEIVSKTTLSPEEQKHAGRFERGPKKKTIQTPAAVDSKLLI